MPLIDSIKPNYDDFHRFLASVGIWGFTGFSIAFMYFYYEKDISVNDLLPVALLGALFLFFLLAGGIHWSSKQSLLDKKEKYELLGLTSKLEENETRLTQLESELRLLKVNVRITVKEPRKKEKME